MVLGLRWPGANRGYRPVRLVAQDIKFGEGLELFDGRMKLEGCPGKLDPVETGFLDLVDLLHPRQGLDGVQLFCPEGFGHSSEIQNDCVRRLGVLCGARGS